MVRNIVVISTICLFLVPLALAQDEYKIELTPYFGYTFSEGVDISSQDIGNGESVDRISPTSALSCGFSLDWLASENFGLGFNFGQQNSSLEGRVRCTVLSENSRKLGV